MLWIDIYGIGVRKGAPFVEKLGTLQNDAHMNHIEIARIYAKAPENVHFTGIMLVCAEVFSKVYSHEQLVVVRAGDVVPDAQGFFQGLRK